MITTVSPYDPGEPEDTPRGSAYLSRKDLKAISLLIVAFFLVLIPIYGQCKSRTEEHICKQNLSQISKAIGLYSQENDDQLPPVYASNLNGTPVLDDQGRPFTWASLVSRYMNDRSSFVCPSAKPEEATSSQHPEKTRLTIPLTYGMYAPYGGYPISHITNPNETALISETSNNGSQDSYDPVRFKGPSGQTLLNDGFIMGFSDSNDRPTKDTSAITRLAFRGSSSGQFGEEDAPRHPSGIFILTVSGSIRLVKAPIARVKMLPTGELPDPWAVPAHASP